MLTASPLKYLTLVAFGLTLAACSSPVDPDSPEGKRQAAFKQILNHSEPMVGMLTGRLSFDGERFAEHAAQLQALSDAPWEYFPSPGNSNQPNAARPKIWSDPEGFSAAVDAYKATVEHLLAVTVEGVDSADQVRGPMTEVQRACKSCHDAYRR
ncbi:c-type cytochrome [Halopseudomonas yangmingensis]|uniref:Cytochrome c556 n=1 Tax=Halopseudomonas yangmingensis TaxID=1720063 RepID=A0A1I4PAK0_9GAMM|nr:cytochrome c [Halopseudomonas yangmingensis]SFM24739.1 Cytochrome c556 [Halopseudomonas yangmingensis]